MFLQSQRALTVVLSALCSTAALAEIHRELPPDPRRDIVVEPGLTPRQAVISIPALPPGAAPSGAVDQLVHFKELQFEGNQAVSAEELKALWPAFTGQSRPLSDAWALASMVTRAYRARGMVLTQAIVPPQQFKADGGSLRIQVVEGFVDAVSWDVKGLSSTEALQPFVEPLLVQRPLSLALLERQLLLLNESGAVQVRAVFAPSTTTAGASTLLLVGERSTASGALSAHNRTSDALGPVRYEAVGRVTGVVGLLDQHRLQTNTSLNGNVDILSYGGQVPLGGKGLQLAWTASATRSRTESMEGFKVNTESQSASVSLSYPMWRSRLHNLDVRAEVSANDSESLFEGERFSRDRIRKVTLGMTWERVNLAGGVSRLDVDAHQGFLGLGSSARDNEWATRLGARTAFTKYTVYGAHLQPLLGRLSGLLALQSQYTPHRLPSAETFALGGEAFLRGHDPSVLSGDRGTALKLELRQGFSVSGKPLTAYAFKDFGWVWSVRSQQGHQHLGSAGLGLRLDFSPRVRGFVEWAHRSNTDTTTSIDDQDAKVYAGLTFEL
ncbi:ShlB/FhaC/HecB family hemolysin secretion/activation protein [Aquabacterium lacunae]|nr:ShlB/FhaC/HecB family hemolysin secretion/activation protein [Aquabacterium lacunae]